MIKKIKKKTVENNDHFSFSDVIIKPQNVIMLEKITLSNNVIYDSDCNQLVTYDKTRFVRDIVFACE